MIKIRGAETASREGENQEQIFSVKCNCIFIPTLWNLVQYKMSAGEEELLITVHINIHVHVSRQGHNCQLSLLEKSLIILNHSFEKL